MEKVKSIYDIYDFSAWMWSNYAKTPHKLTSYMKRVICDKIYTY